MQPVESLQRLEELFVIDQDAYQECSLSFERFKQWWELYPFGSRVLLANDQIQASIGIYPIAAEMAISFQNGEIHESVLQPVSVQECQESPQSFWYASGIVAVEPV
jgi:hypothetical protein